MLAAGRGDDARRRAVDLVEQSHAQPQALTVFRETYEGREAEATEQLLRLRRKHPDDRRMLLALIDFLRGRGQLADASRLLDEASVQSPDDLGLLRRRVALLRQAQKHSAAAVALIDALARHPDALEERGHARSVLPPVCG